MKTASERHAADGQAAQAESRISELGTLARQDFVNWITLWPDLDHGFDRDSFLEFCGDDDHTEAFAKFCELSGLDASIGGDTLEVFAEWERERFAPLTLRITREEFNGHDRWVARDGAGVWRSFCDFNLAESATEAASMMFHADEVLPSSTPIAWSVNVGSQVLRHAEKLAAEGIDALAVLQEMRIEAGQAATIRIATKGLAAQ